jgi:hypothetical protein
LLPAAGGAAVSLRRAVIAALFAAVTLRFAIYLSPGQGRRVPPPATGRQAADAAAHSQRDQ